MIGGIYRSVGERDINEDTIVYEDVSTDRGNCTLIAVCDGIGSLMHGEVVSGYVAECLVKWFYAEGIRYGLRSSRYIKRSICRCIYDCYTDISATARSLGIKWGTTCTCAVVWNDRYMCLNLGDSAALVTETWRPVRRMTAGHLNARGELIRCIGSMGYFAPDISFGRLMKGSGILVASDGFINRLKLCELNEMLKFDGELSEERINRRLSVIGDEIARRGGRDNRSAVYAIRRRR